MNKEKPYFLKRLAAYLIDLIIVSVLATLISLVFIKEQLKTNYTGELMSLKEQLSKKEITEEEFNNLSNDLIYINAKDTVGTTIIITGVSLVYYVILCYFCNGITLGKYLFKLQIVSSKDKKLNIGNYLLRGLLVNSILSYIINAVLVLTLNKEGFLSIYNVSSNVLTIFLLASLITMMYRQDGRGLHDMISGTVVISTKASKDKKEENKEEVVEAKVIEEKVEKEEKKETKNKKTKKKAVKKTGGKK